MSLRALAMPILHLLEILYRQPRIRYLLVEARDAFDDHVSIDNLNPPIRLHINSRMEHQRAVGFFNKEPDTIDWLNGLNPGDIFVDIGANIGVYTLYAAIRRGARVLAFEPEAQNFAALSRNIHTNKIMEKVTAYPIAISDLTGPTILNLSSVSTGASHHTVHAAIGENGGQFEPAFIQGSVSWRLDHLLDVLGPNMIPRFIKIDVDGAEASIIDSLERLLRNQKLEQILVELSPAMKCDNSVFTVLEAAGFKPHQPTWDYRGRSNYIFIRNSSEPAQ